jgi:diguanylate cyclase (GGDEF)-like protein
LYIDLDRFKVINDTYGHAAGDEALRDIGRILLSTVREKDFVGRLGGDEFAIYAVDLPEQDGAFVLAQRLDEALVRHNAKAMAHGRPYALEFSIGVTEVSPDHRTCESVLASADAALYEKKRWR